MVKIKLASSIIELNSIYTFRNKIYIEELGKHFLKKNAQKDVLKDELDDIAYHLYSEDENGNIIASMRCILQSLDERIQSKFKWNENGIVQGYAQLDRFIISKEYRGTRLSLRYMIWIYKFGLKNSVKIALIEIEPKLLKLYQKFGFINYNETFTGNKKDQKRILCYLKLNDRENLEKVRSPYLSILDKHNIEHEDDSVISESVQVMKE